MRYLAVLNWAIFAFNTLMAVVLGVVALMLWIYREQAAGIGSELQPVVVSMSMFVVVAMIAGACCWAMRRRHPLFWPGQMVLVIAISFAVLFLRELLGS